MILGHTIPEIKKTVVAFVIAVAAVIAFFVQFDPNLPEAVAAVLIAALNVVGVFQASRHSYDDISKSIVALVTSGVALYGFFHSFNPGDTEEILAIVGAVLNVGGVFVATNENQPELE
jgi:hypothetical protein